MNNVPDAWSLSKPSARRSLILCSLGALLGLAMAGLSLFTAKGTRTASVPAEDVAIVNQVPILMSDYVQQIRSLYDVPMSEAKAEQKRKVLADMVREELYVQRGVELGLQSDTVEVRTALVGAVEAQVATDARVSQPTELELHAYYQDNLTSFEDEGIMTLADYRLPSGATPQAIAVARQALLAAGPDAASADRAVRRSGRMTDGEEYYFAARTHLGNKLFAVARRLRDGEVSQPSVMPDGVHFIVMQHNVRPVPPHYADVRDKVLASYLDSQAALLTAANDRFLRKRADIQIADGF